LAKIVGQAAPDFQFTTSGGEKRAVAALRGKITVIDFWATWCGWCLKGMPDMEGVRKKYANNDKVQFLALSVDAADVPNDRIAEALKQTKAELPWARSALDPPEKVQLLFDFEGIPGLVVLGPDGKVQYHHMGYDPKLPEKLSPIIDTLLAGKDPSVEAV